MNSSEPFVNTALPTAYPHIGQASLLVPARRDEPELLDLGVGSAEDVQESLADLWRINRYLGGVYLLTRHLYKRLEAHSAPTTVVDIGSGSAEIAGTIARWTQRKQLPVQVIAVDLAARNLALAPANDHLRLMQADATRLPFAPESVDYLISSLFLHHFSPEQVITILRTSFAYARRSIVMSDLIRGWLPLIGFKLVQPVFARSYITRHDGMVSIRRAYTPDEFRELADAAGLRNVRVYAEVPWRMTLVADK